MVLQWFTSQATYHEQFLTLLRNQRKISPLRSGDVFPAAVWALLAAPLDIAVPAIDAPVQKKTARTQGVVPSVVALSMFSARATA